VHVLGISQEGDGHCICMRGYHVVTYVICVPSVQNRCPRAYYKLTARLSGKRRTMRNMVVK
jgi:hypothetical protein